MGGKCCSNKFRNCCIGQNRAIRSKELKFATFSTQGLRQMLQEKLSGELRIRATTHPAPGAPQAYTRTWQVDIICDVTWVLHVSLPPWAPSNPRLIAILFYPFAGDDRLRHGRTNRVSAAHCCTHGQNRQTASRSKKLQLSNREKEVATHIKYLAP